MEAILNGDLEFCLFLSVWGDYSGMTDLFLSTYPSLGFSDTKSFLAMQTGLKAVSVWSGEATIVRNLSALFVMLR